MTEQRDGNSEPKKGDFVCPICDVRMNTREANTTLCPECISKRFFELDDEREIKYRRIIKIYEDALRKKYQDDYDPQLHERMIGQLARSEVMVVYYEVRIANNRESGEMPKLLQNERVHLRAMYNILQTSLQSIRGDKKNVNHNFSDNFVDHLKNAITEAMND